MSEETEVEVTDIPDQADIEVPLEDLPQDEPEEQKTFNPKTDKVDFDKPEQQERFNEVYRQLKKSDQRNAMLTDFLSEAVKKMDELSGVTKEIKNKENLQQEQDAENILIKKLRDAHEEGDNDTFVKTLRELQSFEVNRTAEKIFEQKVNEYTQKERAEVDDSAKYVESLMSEKDDTGNFRRPWLQENHPDFQEAIKELAVISLKYKDDPQILQKSLNDLDKSMGSPMTKTEEPKPQTRAPNPMQGSNLTNHKPKGTIKMTRAEADILKKLERHSGKKIDLKKYEARRAAMHEANRGGR